MLAKAVLVTTNEDTRDSALTFLHDLTCTNLSVIDNIPELLESLDYDKWSNGSVNCKMNWTLNPGTIGLESSDPMVRESFLAMHEPGESF